MPRLDTNQIIALAQDHVMHLMKDVYHDFTHYGDLMRSAESIVNRMTLYGYTFDEAKVKEILAKVDASARYTIEDPDREYLNQDEFDENGDRIFYKPY